MRRIIFGALFLIVQGGAVARGQFIGAGSTPQGDYLRGLGIAAAGLGSFNLDTARANEINTRTAINLDIYVQTVLRQGRDNFAKLDRQQQDRLKSNYEAIRKRISEHPEGLDIMTGNALNAAMDRLNDPAIQPSSFRSAPVAVPVSLVRRIPFKLDEKGVNFSIQRLTARGPGKWPVAFQADPYAPERKAYDKAIDNALEQMIEGKVTPEVIAAYEAAVRDLSTKLEREYGLSRDRRYVEAKTRINEMEKATNLLKTQKIQLVMAEIDRYTGATVNDLRLFMQAHNLRFALADSADERRAYVDLYAALDQVRGIVTDQGGARER